MMNFLKALLFSMNLIIKKQVKKIHQKEKVKIAVKKIYLIIYIGIVEEKNLKNDKP
jgi:hypothetical protein